ncbi:hypothetical protein EDD85DRAFT_956562 [Armillaria nabsnona]|nr:hypothetical protein EDD85DRAFT_956562 [Armillaria nabsnona]
MAHVTVNHLVQTTIVCCLRVQHAAFSTSNQKGDRDHDALRVMPNYPVPLSSANHQWLQTDTIGLENDITFLKQQTRRLRAYLSDLRRTRKRKEFQLECRKSNITPIWSMPHAVGFEPCVSSLAKRRFVHGGAVVAAPPFISCSLERNPLSVNINSSNKFDAILDCLVPHHSRQHTEELNLCLPGLKALSMLVANLLKLTFLRLSVEGETLLDIISRPLAHPVDTFLSAQLLSDVYLEGIGMSHVAVPLKQLTRFAGDIFRVEDYVSLFKDAFGACRGGTLDAVSDRALVSLQRSVMACSTLATLFHFRIEERKDNVELKSLLLRWARISMLSSESRSAHWRLFLGIVICPFFYTAKILKKAAPHGYTKTEYC